MSWFSKKPVIEFACRGMGLEKIMPIIPAKQYKHEWTTRMFKEFAKLKKHPDFEMKKHRDVAQCPGIIGITRQGWILRAWQDVLIETSEDGTSYKWETPFDEKQLHDDPAVDLHPPKDFVDFFEIWDAPTKFVFKFNVMWDCKIPKGYALLTIPVAYAEENRFEAVPGIKTYEYGWQPMNPQLKWKAPPGKTLIKAGTPLAQYILLKIEDVEEKIYYSAKAAQAYKLASLFLNRKFISKPKETKDFLGKHNND